MATFLPGVSDAPAQQRLYTPDYQFLTQVYGTKQAQYDRGFNMMRTMYNSKMGARVSSEDNAAFRDEFFKKAQDNLKQAAGVDLSNPNNIKKAMSIFDPLVNDDEFNYDVNLTAYLEKQLQRGEALKNSADPEQRRMYNEMASEYVNNALNDLKGSRRGDGSIGSVQKRDFVAFEDEAKFLQELSQKSGLKVTKVSAPGDGYIYKMTNGEKAVDAMSEWATTMMGDRFDAQHRVQASVMLERQAKGLMQSQGISKQEAMQQVGVKIQANLIDQHARRAVEMQEFATDTDKRIASIERTHGTKNIPPQIAARYQQLQEMKKVMDERVRNHSTELENLNDMEYVTGNMLNITSSQVKRNAAHSWGKATAMATAEEDISSDTTTTTKWKMALDQSIHNSQMKWNYAKHASDREFDMIKLKAEEDRYADQRAVTLQNNMANQDLARLRLGIEQAKDENGGKMPTKVDLGSYTAPGQTMDVSQVLQAEEQATTKSIFNNAFSPAGGLLTYVMGPKSHQYYPTLNKLQRVAGGDGVELSQKEIASIKELGAAVGVKINGISNRAQARAAMLNIAHGTYKQAEKGPTYDESGQKVTNASQASDAMTRMLGDMSQMISVTQRNMLNNRIIAQQVLDEKGQPRKGFEKAQIYGYDAGNNPLVDLSGVNPELRASLGAAVAKDYREQTRTTGRRMAYSGHNPALFVNALNPNMIHGIRFNGKDITSDYLKGEHSSGIMNAIAQMGIPDLEKTFGESVIANYDPSSRTVQLELKIAADSPLKGFKAFKGGTQGSLQVSMSYDAIMNNPTLRAKFGEDVRANTASYGGVAGATALMNDPTAVIRQTPFHKAQGFEYSAYLGEDASGRPIISLNYTYLDPIKNESVHKSLPIPVDPSSRETFEQVDRNINQAFHGWKGKVSDWEKAFLKNTPK